MYATANNDNNIYLKHCLIDNDCPYQHTVSRIHFKCYKN